jgi:iron complex outermembrane receptor protein
MAHRGRGRIRSPKGLRALLIGGAALLSAGQAMAAATDGVEIDGQDVNRLSIEELANLEITSVSRRPESVAQAAAAVYVIDAEDIRRSGAANLPEALRLAPNLQVQRIDSAGYAITARGFNSLQTANKLLVMIDGRSVYSPLFSGVFWDSQDVALDEVDRVEVISGPGGALYGANAVNGVINVISKPAQDSQGFAFSGAAGTDDSQAAARYGGRIGRDGAYRVYLSGATRGTSYLPGGAEADDETSGLQAGFRTDWGSEGDRFTVQGDVYDRDVVAGEARGHNLLGRWTRSFQAAGSLEVQAYYDRADRDEGDTVSEQRTFDVAVQHGFQPFAGHTLVWGGGYRRIEDDFTITTDAVLDPASADMYQANLFAQDQIALGPDVTLTLGLKAENGTFRELEYLPSVRLGWAAGDNAFFWGAISRAVRIPSRIDRNLVQPGFLVGGTFQREELWAYELGYRGQPTSNTSLSISLFYNNYDDLRTVDLDPVTVLPIHFGNSAEGRTYGLEIWGGWQVIPAWRLSAGVFTLDKDFKHKQGSLDITAIASQGDDPDYQATLRSEADLTDRVEFDVSLRAVGALATTPSYVEADARLGWRVNDQVELQLSGFNLLDEMHFESDNAGTRRQIGRSVQLGLRWRY